MAEDKKPEEVVDDTTELDDDEFINSLLEDEEETKKEEEKDDRPQKNRDAEEARKRRAAEAKKEEEEETGQQDEEEETPKSEDDEVEAKDSEEEQEQDERSANENKLGEQLVKFKQKYPNVEIAELDKDTNFKKYIDGKLLGKKDFTALYEEYIDFRSEISGVEKAEVEKNFRKANSSSGSSKQGGSNIPSDIYSIEEIEKLNAKLPFMNFKESKAVQEKLDKSLKYHNNN